MLTPTSVDSGSAVYTTLPQALGLQVGMLVQDPNTGHLRQLVQYDPAAVGNLAVSAAVKVKTGDNYIVQADAAIGDYTLGANDLSGVVILPAQFLWVSVSGQFRPLVAAGVAAGAIVAASAVAGELDLAVVAASPNVQQANIRTLVASGAGGATLCQIG